MYKNKINPLLSLIVPSRRPNQLRGLLNSIEDTISDPNSIEVLVKIDDDLIEAEEAIKKEIKEKSFKINYITSGRLGGVFTLWVPIDDLYMQCSKESYFLATLTDETRFKSKNWDLKLREYVGLFEDDVFRLRISNSKFVNYPSHLSTCTKPESFPVLTRRWFELVGGMCNFCYAGDVPQQSIAFHLSLGRKSYYDLWQSEAQFRDVQVHGIEFSGFEFAQNITEQETITRNLYMLREWRRMNSYFEQREAAYKAKRIKLYCECISSDIKEFKIIRRETDHTVAVIDGRTNQLVRRESYSPPRLPIYFYSFILFLSFFPKVFRIKRFARKWSQGEKQTLKFKKFPLFNSLNYFLKYLLCAGTLVFIPLSIFVFGVAGIIAENISKLFLQKIEIETGQIVSLNKKNYYEISIFEETLDEQKCFMKRKILTYFYHARNLRMALSVFIKKFLSVFVRCGTFVKKILTFRRIKNKPTRFFKKIFLPLHHMRDFIGKFSMDKIKNKPTRFFKKIFLPLHHMRDFIGNFSMDNIFDRSFYVRCGTFVKKILIYHARNLRIALSVFIKKFLSVFVRCGKFVKRTLTFRRIINKPTSFLLNKKSLGLLFRPSFRRLCCDRYLRRCQMRYFNMNSLKTFLIFPLSPVIIPIEGARFLLKICFALAKTFWFKFVKYIDEAFRIPPAGIMRRWLGEHKTFENYIAITGYPIPSHDEMISEFERQKIQKKELDNMTFKKANNST